MYCLYNTIKSDSGNRLGNSRCEPLLASEASKLAFPDAGASNGATAILLWLFGFLGEK